MPARKLPLLALFSFALVAVAFSHTVFADNTTISTPRMYWRADTSSGATLVHDFSGNGFHGSLYIAAPTFSTDIPTNVGVTNSGSLRFVRASTQALRVTRPVQDDFTLCAWFKTTSTGPNVWHFTTMPLFESEVGGAGNDFGFGIDNTGKLAFGVGPVDTTYRTTLAYNTGDWTHTCAVREKANGGLKIFVNGIHVASGTGSAGNSLSANPNMFVGMGTDGANYWDGNIDELRVYNTALIASDIYALGTSNYGGSSSSSSSSSSAGGGADMPSWLLQLRAQNNLDLRGKPATSSASSASSSSASSVSMSMGIEHPAASSSSSSSSFSVSPATIPLPFPIQESLLQIRTCSRVSKWVSGSALTRLNERLMKRYGFECHA